MLFYFPEMEKMEHSPKENMCVCAVYGVGVKIGLRNRQTIDRA